MPGRRPSQFYSQDDMDNVCGIALPPKLKCGRCNQNLITTKFSNKQLTDARYYIKDHGRITKPISCMKCTGQQIVELECTVCEKTQGLECFAKTQRNKPDSAICFACTEIQVNDTAINDSWYDDPDRAFIPGDQSAGQTPEYWSSQQSATDEASTTGDEWSSFYGDDSNDNAHDGGIALSDQFKTLHVNGSVDESLIGSEYDHPAVSRSGDSQIRSNKSWHTKSAGPHSTPTGFNKNTYGKPSFSSASGSIQSFSSSTAERLAPEIRSNGWAKIRSAHNPSPILCGPMRPMGDSARELESVTDAWADEDEDDEDDDDDDDDDDTVI